MIKATLVPTKAPKVYGPGGVQYDPPKSDKPVEKPNVDLRPKSESVGASAKPLPQPPAAKSRPQSPAPKAMPSSSSTTIRHPPPPPRQDESGGHSTYAEVPSSTCEPAQSSQTPVNNSWSKGRGKGGSRGNKGWSRRTNRSWEYYPG